MDYSLNILIEKYIQTNDSRQLFNALVDLITKIFSEDLDLALFR